MRDATEAELRAARALRRAVTASDFGAFVVIGGADLHGDAAAATPTCRYGALADGTSLRIDCACCPERLKVPASTTDPAADLKFAARRRPRHRDARMLHQLLDNRRWRGTRRRVNLAPKAARDRHGFLVKKPDSDTLHEGQIVDLCVRQVPWSCRHQRHCEPIAAHRMARRSTCSNSRLLKLQTCSGIRAGSSTCVASLELSSRNWKTALYFFFFCFFFFFFFLLFGGSYEEFVRYFYRDDTRHLWEFRRLL